MPDKEHSMRFFSDRVEFGEALSRRDVKRLVSYKDVKVLQCSRSIRSKTWRLLNDQFFSKRPDVTLRLWGFPKQVCDLTFTARMTNVHHFAADSLMDAVGMEHLAAMEKLESLGVGIFNIEDFNFLNTVSHQLKSLSLEETKSKKPDLSILNRFTELEKIYIEGHRKNIEVLAQLEKLQDVTLRSITTPDLGYLKTLNRLWSLDIKLGGIKDLYAIEGMENIKYLELWQIRGLSDIGVVSTLKGLQNLFFQSLRQIKALPSFKQNMKLRRIYLENMKGLEDINSLEYTPALEEFAHLSAANLQPEDYIPLLRNPSLKRAAAFFGSDKRNNRFRELAQEYNIEPTHAFEKFNYD